MGQPITSLKKSTKTQTGADLNGFVKDMAYGVQSASNQKTRVQTVTSTSNKYQKRNRLGDQFTTVNGDNLEFSISDSKGNLITRSLASGIGSFLSDQEGSTPPTLSNYPTEGAWGWYYDTATGFLYLPKNVDVAGTPTLKNITISTLDGTITGTQHGNLNAYVGTMHAFTQISGTITAAQHGNLTTGGPLHSFGVISGTIDDTQHGTRGGGTLHSAAAGSTAGFMSAADKTKLDASTNTPTANALVEFSAGGNLNVTSQYAVGGTKVVGARSTGWTAPTATQSKAGFANGATATEIEQNLSAVINALITHGLLGA